jgi:hypothetical protein
MHHKKINVMNGPTPHDASHKENTPLTTTTTSSAFSNSNKRKLSDRDLAMTTLNLKAKKSKMDATGDGPSHPMVSEATDTNLEFPNGPFYCHQCGRKRDLSRELHVVPSNHLITLFVVGIQCTFGDSKNRCKVKFCRSCLKNRYGQNMDQIKATGERINADRRNGHIEGEGYFFKYMNDYRV